MSLHDIGDLVYTSFIVRVSEKMDSVPERVNPYVVRSGGLSYSSPTSADPMDFLAYQVRSLKLEDAPPVEREWVVLSNFQATGRNEYGVDYRVRSGSPPAAYLVIDDGDLYAYRNVQLEESGQLTITISPVNLLGDGVRAYLTRLPPSPVASLATAPVSGEITLGASPSSGELPPLPTATPRRRSIPPTVAGSATHVDDNGEQASAAQF